MGLILSQVFLSTGAAGVMGQVECRHGVQNLSCYIAHSSLTSTASFQLESAIDSTGPWFVEGSTSSTGANVSTTFRLQITGPVAPFVRVRLLATSTGQFNVLLMGVD